MSQDTFALAELLGWVKQHALQTQPQGLRLLFSGKPGAGKKRAARWLAEHTKREFIRVDVSAWLSVYIGETEKNLRQLLERAETSQAILLFDEADALFGLRDSQPSASHDKYANQEVSYLRDLFATYPGLLIVSTRRPVELPTLWLRHFDRVVAFP